MLRNIYSQSVIAALTSTALLLTACDMNTERRSETNASLKAQCVKGLDLNQLQGSKLEKYMNDDMKVFRTIIIRDDASGKGQKLGLAQVFKQKTAKEMVTAKEMISLDKDCKNLRGNLMGVGALQGLSARITEITATSIKMINGKPKSKFHQMIEIEAVQAGDKAVISKAGTPQDVEAIRVRITERGEVRRDFEAIQLVENKDQESFVTVADSVAQTVTEILGDELSQEAKGQLALRAQTAGVQPISTKVIAEAMDAAVAKSEQTGALESMIQEQQQSLTDDLQEQIDAKVKAQIEKDLSEIKMPEVNIDASQEGAAGTETTEQDVDLTQGKIEAAELDQADAAATSAAE